MCPFYRRLGLVFIFICWRISAMTISSEFLASSKWCMYWHILHSALTRTTHLRSMLYVLQFSKGICWEVYYFWGVWNSSWEVFISIPRASPLSLSLGAVLLCHFTVPHGQADRMSCCSGGGNGEISARFVLYYFAWGELSNESNACAVPLSGETLCDGWSIL